MVFAKIICAGISAAGLFGDYRGITGIGGATKH